MSVSPSPSTSSPFAESRRGPASGVEAGPPLSGMPWLRLAVVAAILAASGGARLWQERRLEQTLRQGRISPFPLADLPMNLDSWKGQDVAMDPKIVRISGSTDHISRCYINQRTGVRLDLFILYGPTFDVSMHTAEVCYPSIGYEPLPGAVDRPIRLEDGATIPFRSLAFRKGEQGIADTQEVYYSHWYDGRWTTDSASPKAAARIPGMYRVQVSRRLSDRERRDIDNPCEPFLAALIGELDARIARGPQPSTGGR
jgi:hypothetical protein